MSFKLSLMVALDPWMGSDSKTFSVELRGDLKELWAAITMIIDQERRMAKFIDTISAPSFPFGHWALVQLK